MNYILRSITHLTEANCGGFGYIEYEDPVKNKLIIMTRETSRNKRIRISRVLGRNHQGMGKRQVEKESDGWLKEMPEDHQARSLSAKY